MEKWGPSQFLDESWYLYMHLEANKWKDKVAYGGQV